MTALVLIDLQKQELTRFEGKEATHHAYLSALVPIGGIVADFLKFPPFEFKVPVKP